MARTERTGGAGTVGIVGLGLIGGSLARDLAAGGWRVLGSDRNPATEAAAREAGVVVGPVDPGDVDVLLLAVPVRAAPGWLHRLPRELGPDTIVTDVGSTKRSVVEAAEAAGLGPRFVGAHPMAGHHSSGWDAAREGLFQDAVVWLCPTHDTAPETMARIDGLWRAVGAEPRRIDAHDHDRLLARTSHLPQAAATALAAALARAGTTPDDLGPGGRDMTRLAASDPDLWADILVDNSDHVDLALGALIDELTRLRRAVRDLDDATLRSLLAAGRAWSRGEREPEAKVAGVDRL